MKSLGIELSDDDKRLPYLYWTSKLHKSPVKHHFNAFKHKNGASRYTHIKVGRNKSYFTSNPINSDNKYTANDICKMIEFLVWRTAFSTNGIPMGTNCAPLLADLFLYSYENEFLETTESTSVASYLDLLFIRDKSNNITTKLYNKCDAFGFHIMNFPFMSSNIPSAPAYGVYASQLIC